MLRKVPSARPLFRAATVVSMVMAVACRTSPQPLADSRGSASPVEHGVERGVDGGDPRVAVTPIPPLPAGARTDDEKNTIAVFRQAAPSTVFVTQKRTVVDYLAGTAEEVPAGSGSGFVWDSAGHVVTNFHVVKDAESLSVTFQGQQSFPAKVVGVEPRKDIAVIQVDAPAGLLRPVPVEQHVALEVGQKTLAIGNPFGLDHSLTTGIVSALGRQVQGIGGVTIRDMIQTDAAINPGNSGGPLLDSAGQLIGMNTMIFSKSGSSAGIGFAVPVSTIARVVPQIIKSGKAEQLGLGIQVDPLARLERRLGLRGVVVLAVPEGSPAAKTGLHGIVQTTRGLALGDVIVGVDAAKVDDFDDLYNALDLPHAGARGDVIVGVDAAKVDDFDDLYNALDVHHAGDRVDVKVRRGDGTETLKLEVIVL